MWIKKSIAEIPTTKHPLEVVEDLITTGSITDISLEIDDIGTENEYVKIMFKNKKGEVKEDENRELNAIIDRLSEDNERLNERIESCRIIHKALLNQIYGKKGN
jgi:hypothetical protein